MKRLNSIESGMMLNVICKTVWCSLQFDLPPYFVNPDVSFLLLLFLLLFLDEKFVHRSKRKLFYKIEIKLLGSEREKAKLINKDLPF